MASTNKILQHPSHPHPLEIKENLSYETCDLCRRKIWSKDYYTCREGCETPISYHRACAEAPQRIDSHPLHPKHPLTLSHGRRVFRCDHCYQHFGVNSGSFRCDVCEFYLDTGCALSVLQDIGGPQGGKTWKKITLPLHRHTLTSFSTRHDFVQGSDCCICRESVGGDGYTCLLMDCDFIIHKRCVQDLYYADGTKAPTVYHGHQMEIWVGQDDAGSRTCAGCGSDESGEFIGCGCCGVFYHRECFQVPEIITYPYHRRNLGLSLDIGTHGECHSCSVSLKDQIYYRCDSSELLMHIECALKVVGYVEEDMSPKIELSWHRHPLFLCHATESSDCVCNYCQNVSIGPTYVCKEEDCGFTLDKRCTEVESTITHPHHPDHPLSLDEREDLVYDCPVCGERAYGLKFSCKRCLFDLHVECAILWPTHKHYLHEHMLVRLESFPHANCNRCGRSTIDSPLFRCVPCNFNLHEECTELPRVVKSKIHWHPLTIQSKFLEDDSGEYYCEECEQTRDPRLGVYVCGQCHISIPRIYHIHCVLPELAEFNANTNVSKNKSLVSAIDKVKELIANKKVQLEQTKRELDELEKELDGLLEESRGHLKQF